MRMHKVVTGMLVSGVLVSGCSGGDNGNDQAIAPTATVVIEAAAPTAVVTATSVAPTAQVESTPTVDPTPTPDAQAIQDAAVIAAWERYLELSFAARGKDPSPEALDFDSYVTGGAKDGLIGAIERDIENDRYVSGTVRSVVPTFFIMESGDVRVSDCVDIDLATFTRNGDAPLETQVGSFTAEARLEPQAEGWIVAGYESSDRCGD